MHVSAIATVILADRTLVAPGWALGILGTLVTLGTSNINLTAKICDLIRLKQTYSRNNEEPYDSFQSKSDKTGGKRVRSHW